MNNDSRYGSIKLDYNNCMVMQLTENGITDADMSSLNRKAKQAILDFKQNRGTEMMGWTELPYNQEVIIKDIINTAKDVRRKIDNFVVLGIGGSALGAMAVFQALCHTHHNLLKKNQRKAPRFFVEDNVDPVRMKELFDVLDLDKTMFNVITKSGSTSETMSQYLIIMNMLKEKLGAKAKDHIIATTDKEKGNLIKIAKAEGLKTFFVPDGCGGRFSVISPVGLFPAAVLGIDIKKLLKGCKEMDKMCRKANYLENPALASALIHYLAMKNGKNISVMMPYSDSLKLMADWYAQLWGESLGKAIDNDGNLINVGQTPVKSLGVTDQHSQVQLYVEGPYDKIITLIGVERYKDTVQIPAGAEDFPAVSFLSNHTMNELITNEMMATEYALTKNNRMNMRIMLPLINEFYLGQLFMFFMIETAYMGSLLKINAFNQPGVEEGKNATYALFGRAGYEEKAKELASAKEKSDKYIIFKA